MGLGGVPAMGSSCASGAMCLAWLAVGVHHIVPIGLWLLLAILSWSKKGAVDFEGVSFMSFLLNKPYLKFIIGQMWKHVPIKKQIV